LGQLSPLVLQKTAENQWENSEVIKLTSQPLGNVEMKKSKFDLLI